MSLGWTLLLLVIAGAGLGACMWWDRRPYMPGQAWVIPHHAVMFVCLLLLVAAAAHLIALLTGSTLPGRFGI